MTEEYNEDSIVFHRVEFDPRYDWRLAEEWGQQYGRPPSFILRGLMACRECSISPAWFKSKYLERDPKTERREDVEEAHRRLIEEDRAKR